MFSSLPSGIIDKLQNASVFIAGAGGLGSNAAMLLVRAGIRNIVIADFDCVEISNLNRQFYFYNQLGLKKVDALEENLQRINPNINICRIDKKMKKDNFDDIIPENCDLILECFDKINSKLSLTEFCISKRAHIPYIAVSGCAGINSTDDIKIKKKTSNFYIVGDDYTDISEFGTISSRVMAASAIQAHLGLRLILQSHDVQ